MADHHDHGTHGSGHGHHTSNHTTLTFMAGIIAAVVVGMIVFLLIQFILGMLWRGGSAPLMFWLKLAASTAAGVVVGYTLFKSGSFKITPGQRAYLMLFGVPIEWLSLGAGDGWLIPGIMSIKVEDGRGKTINPGTQANTTSNGIEVSSDVAGTYEVLDLLHRDHMIDSGSVEKFVSAELVSAVRAFIAVQTLDIDEAMSHGELTTEQALSMIKKIAQFRHGVERNGNEIMKKVNEKINPYGLRLSSLQIEDVALPKEIEDAAKRVLSETVESAGLTKDAKNKASVAEELLKLFSKMGVDLSKLTPEQAADYIDRNLDRAMAAEDKATIKRINFGGTPPKGTMLNTGE